MKQATLRRIESRDYGTPGQLTSDDKKFQCFIIEPPDRGNKPMISCILKGEYICQWVKSSRWGHIYQLEDANGRTVIQIHRGNWAGDKSKGFRSNSLGCLLPGKTLTRISFNDKENPEAGQQGVTRSRDTLEDLEKYFNHEPFKLKIINVWEEPCVYQKS